MTPLEKMNKFLCSIDKERFRPTFSSDGKLYILHSLDEYQEEVLDKCNELGLAYCMSRDPVFGDADPYTLEQLLIGFRNFQYWFEEMGDKYGISK